MKRSLVPYTGVEYLFGGAPKIPVAPVYKNVPRWARTEGMYRLFGDQSNMLAPLVGGTVGLGVSGIAESVTDNPWTIAGTGIGAGLLAGGGLATMNMLGKRWRPALMAESDKYYNNVISKLDKIGDMYGGKRTILSDDVERILSHSEAAQSAGLKNFHFSPTQQGTLDYWKHPVALPDFFASLTGSDPRVAKRKNEIYQAFMNPLANMASLEITPRAFHNITKY